jgi:hypothetical protein
MGHEIAVPEVQTRNGTSVRAGCRGVTRDPGVVPGGAPACRTRSAHEAVYVADHSLHHVSEWVESALAADDAIDQLVCHSGASKPSTRSLPFR